VREELEVGLGRWGVPNDVFELFIRENSVFFQEIVLAGNEPSSFICRKSKDDLGLGVKFADLAFGLFFGVGFHPVLFDLGRTAEDLSDAVVQNTEGVCFLG